MTTAGSASVEVVPDLSKFQSQVGAGVQKSSSGLKTKLTSFGAALGITLGAAMAVQIGKSSLAAFNSFSTSQARLGFGLKKLGEDGAAQLQPILDWASGFSSQTGVLVGDLVDMASRLTVIGSEFFKAMGPDAGQWVERITQGLTDMAAATGKSASMLMRSLGPALLNAPEKATTVLQKQGVLTDQQVAKVKALVAAGHRQAATQLEVNAITAKYAGAAAKNASSVDKLAAGWNKIQIRIGGFLAKGANFLVWLTGASKGAATLRDVLGALALGIGLYVLALNAASIAQTVALMGMYALDAALAINPFVAIAAAVVIAAVLIIRNWGAVKRFTLAAWRAIIGALTTAWHWITSTARSIWKTLYHILSFTPIVTMFRIQWDIIKGYFRVTFAVIRGIVKVGMAVIRSVILPGMHVIAGVVHTVLHAISSAWHSVWGTFAPVVSTVFGAVVSAVKSGINLVIHAINALIHAYNVLPGHTDIGSIPALARGGTAVVGGRARVGEHGPEEIYLPTGASVVPLSGLSGGNGGRYALTITNWEQGTGFLTAVASDVDRQDANFSRGASRMRMPS